MHPPTSTKKNRYRPEIDGLRALAVGAVIINHFNKGLLPSGYLGVDIFFVISGYVITSSLAGRKSTNFADFLLGFYERRIKRLVPALTVCVLIASVLISIFNPYPTDALKTGVASLFGLSNLYLFRESTNYFAETTDLNPFTHTWSLGVEEQFYMLFPFLVWFSGFGRQKTQGARNLSLVVGVLTIASLVSFIYLYQSNQPAAYFLMQSRFWEIAVGCLICTGFPRLAIIEQALEKIPPLLVTVAMVGVMFFPISAAVPATISIVILSAVLIVCIKEGTAAYKLFTFEKIVYIGLISYSLYLWHWVVLCISRWTIGIHWWSVPIQVGLILLASIGSYRWIETPIRQSTWSPPKWLSLAGGISLLTFGATAISIPLLINTSYINDQKRGSLAAPELSSELCKESNNFSGEELLSKCLLKTSSGISIISIGDSQTEHLLPMLNLLNQKHGIGIMYYSQSGTNFPSLIEARSTGRLASDFRKDFQRSVEAFDLYMEKAKPNDILLLSSRYELRWGKYPIPQSHRQLRFTYYDKKGAVLSQNHAFLKWEGMFKELAEKAKKKGLRVVVVNPIPTFVQLLPSKLHWFNRMALIEQKHLYLTRGELLDHYRKVNEVFKSLQREYSNFYVFDAFHVLCPPPDSRKCSPNAYRDEWHLSKQGAETLYPAFISFLQEKSLFDKVSLKK